MNNNDTQGPKLTFLGLIVVLAVVGGSIYGAYYLLRGSWGSSGTTDTTPGGTTIDPGNTSPGTSTPGHRIAIGIAAGTEKREWLTAAIEEFNKTDAGKKYQINLIPMGSIEGAMTVQREDEKSKSIHVWAPASSLYTENFAAEWSAKHGKSPIARSESLALTPMVFVFWEERHTAFAAKYGAATFKNISQALSEPGGWQAIASKPEWGLFKFGQTHPNESNSGLMTLVLMASDYFGKSKDVSMNDILNLEFVKWINQTQAGVSGLSNSTGNLMRDMLLKGPSTYDCVVVYEANVIANIKTAEGRWGKLSVDYPKYNAWNENPYYILDVPWSSPEQKQAAEAFLKFLMTEPIQKMALTYGFRPGNLQVPVIFEGSPFVAAQTFGVKQDLGTIVTPPPPAVLTNMLQAWQRGQGGR